MVKILFHHAGDRLGRQASIGCRWERIGKVQVVKRDRVRGFLLDLIEDGRPGSAIPPERELCTRLGVSRPTLRAAMDELVRAGFLVRERGRGTFTTHRKISQELPADRPTPPAEGVWLSQVLEFGTEPAGARVGAKLRLAPETSVLRVVRLRLVEAEPVGLERIHVPAHLVPDLTAHDLESGNFYALLRNRFEIVVAEAEQTIEPTVVDEAEAELLDTPLHAPALLFGRVTRDAGGTLVEYTRSIYRGDRYRLTTTLRFDRDSG